MLSCENAMKESFSWDDLRYLLEAVRCGSCAAAARELGVAVTTVTRRIDAFERSLQQTLVRMTPDGITLTEDGARLVEKARRVEETMALFQQHLKQSDEVAGAVRVSAIATLASEFLAPKVKSFVEQYPAIELTLVGESNLVDVLRGEADVVVRLSRPRHKDLMVRQIGQIPMSLYASPDYLSRFGTPTTPVRSLAGHRLVDMSRDFSALPISRWLTARAEGASIVFRASQTTMLARAVRDGVGLGVLPDVMAEGLVRVSPLDGLFTESIWIGYHEDMRSVPRIRAVVDWLIRTLAGGLGTEAPDPGELRS